MSDLSAFPIASRWPAQHPDRLQLYSFPTPNGVKVSIALEEIGLPYEAHLINIMQNETATPDFLSLNPNGKIPAIIDPNGPGGKPLALFESGAILLYLAEKTGKLMPSDPARRYETIAVGILPDGRVSARCSASLASSTNSPATTLQTSGRSNATATKSKRLLGVLETRLNGRKWIMDDEYTIADISMLGWVRTLKVFYEVGEMLGMDNMKNVMRWLEAGLARPASERGLNIPARP